MMRKISLNERFIDKYVNISNRDWVEFSYLPNMKMWINTIDVLRLINSYKKSNADLQFDASDLQCMRSNDIDSVDAIRIYNNEDSENIATFDIEFTAKGKKIRTGYELEDLHAKIKKAL